MVASEADRAPSEEDLLPFRPEWVRVPAEVEREPFSSATCFSPAGMSMEVAGLGVALVVVAVVVVVVGWCAGAGPCCCLVEGWSGGEALEGPWAGCFGSR